MADRDDVAPAFDTHIARVGALDVAHWHERGADVSTTATPSPSARRALVCVHGWPETKRIYGRIVEPLRDAGHDVVVPDLRGFGESGFAPDGVYDVPTHARDVAGLVFDVLGYDTAVLIGGDLGGPVIQEIALRHPGRIEAMVLFNSPLPYDKERMAGLRTRAPKETADYFVRQGTDADALAAELSTPEARTAYIAEFYTTRLWAHPGAFDAVAIEHHSEPFADAARLRASFANYEAVFDPAKRSEPSRLGRNDTTPTLIVFGTSDHVIYPDFDLMAAQVFARHVGPFRYETCGHFVPWEAPGRFVTDVVGFLNEAGL